MKNRSSVSRVLGAALLAAGILSGCTPKPLTTTSADDPEVRALSAERATFRQKKVAVIEQAMNLSPAEHDPFWREYYQYEDELRKLNDQRYQIIRDYAAYYDKMTDAIADNIARRSLNFREDRTKLARKYYDRIRKATSAITAARFLQLENEITLLADLKISSETPIFPKGMNPIEVK